MTGGSLTGGSLTGGSLTGGSLTGGSLTGGIGLDRLSLNQATVKHLSLAEAVALCARHDIPAIGLWRDRVAEAGLAEAAAAVRAAGLRVSSLCRGGFFTVADPDGRRAARADNLAALAEAAELGTGTLVLVSGGLPPGQRDLGLARRMIADAIGELVPEASRLGVRLGIEALHPMFCADRCVISSLGEAVDLALLFPADAVGVVVDTYHVWWDARLADEIARAGRRIVSFQVCDWVLPLPRDTLLGRGHVGDGVIDFAPIAASVAAAGYHGDVEVEIFNAEVWDAPPDQTAATVRERFAAVLGGAPGGVLDGRRSARRSARRGARWAARADARLKADFSLLQNRPYQTIRRGCPSHAAAATWLGHPRRIRGAGPGRRPGITRHRNITGTQEHQGPRPGATCRPPMINSSSAALC